MSREAGFAVALTVSLLLIVFLLIDWPPELAPLYDINNPYRIPEGYMVCFKDGVPDAVVRSVVDDLQTNCPEAGLIRLEPRRFVVGNLPEACLRRLRRNPDVEGIYASVMGFADSVPVSPPDRSTSR